MYGNPSDKKGEFRKWLITRKITSCWFFFHKITFIRFTFRSIYSKFRPSTATHFFSLGLNEDAAPTIWSLGIVLHASTMAAFRESQFGWLVEFDLFDPTRKSPEWTGQGRTGAGTRNLSCCQKGAFKQSWQCEPFDLSNLFPLVAWVNLGLLMMALHTSPSS